MLCDQCKSREAIIYQWHTGRKLCLKCFELDLLKRIKQSLRDFGVNPQDKVLLAVSGGKDSLVMMKLVSMVHPKENLCAITIIEGFPNYDRSKEIAFTRKLANELSIDYVTLRVKDVIGLSVWDMVERARQRGLGLAPCTFCGIVKRRVLNYYARLNGFDKVATAHTLNDEIQTAILNILRGDKMRLAQWHPKSAPHSVLLIKRVKPLRKVYEYEIAAYAYLNDIPFQLEQCPYLVSHPTLRARLKPFIIEYEHASPGAMIKFLEFLDRTLEPIVDDLNRGGIVLPLCEKCGEPTSPGRRLCRLCELIDALGLDSNLD